MTIYHCTAPTSIRGPFLVCARIIPIDVAKRATDRGKIPLYCGARCRTRRNGRAHIEKKEARLGKEKLPAQ
jgi:hypothetical protein